ncbi:MAG: ribosome small subunit-dependent GTPase A, partial [Planctomycetes bacterium]|nr:ribosome small subunit-dependent GTPase A [Planctomycetota bacterium]
MSEHDPRSAARRFRVTIEPQSLLDAASSGTSLKVRVELPAEARSDAARVVGLARTRVFVRVGAVEFDLPRPLGLELAIGDDVELASGRVVARGERRSRLARPDPANPRRELVLAANVDLALIVTSVVAPPLVPGLVDRLFVALAASELSACVLVNKVELLGDSPAAARELEELEHEWRELGCDALRVSAATGVGLDALRARLAGKTAVLVGHSGVGKTSLVNALAPSSLLAIGGVSTGNLRGRHTTSAGRLVELAGSSTSASAAWLVDTPGVREFGLGGVTRADLRAAFADFTPFAARCRFADCAHVAEPDCAVRVAVERGELRARRFASYVRLAATLER